MYTHLQVMQPVLTRVTRFVADKRGGILPVLVSINASLVSEEVEDGVDQA